MHHNFFIYLSVDGHLGCVHTLAIVNSAAVNIRDACMHACVLSCFSSDGLFVTLQTVSHQPPLSTGFSRQEYWSGLSSPSPGDISDPGIEPAAPALQADSLSETLGKPRILGVYKSFKIFVFSGYMPSTGIAGSYSSFIPSFFFFFF